MADDDEGTPVPLARVARHEWSSVWTVSVPGPSLSVVAELSLDDRNSLAVDVLDLTRLVDLVVDVDTAIGAAMAEAWIGPSAMAALRASAGPATVEVVGGPVARCLGEAAMCGLFAVFDGHEVEDVWMAEQLARLVDAFALEPRLEADVGGLVDRAVRGLRTYLERVPDEEERTIVHDYCKVIGRAPGAAPMASALSGLTGADGAGATATPERAARRTPPEASPSLVAGSEGGAGATDGAASGRAEVVVVIGRLGLPSGLRLDPGATARADVDGRQLSITIAPVSSFPNQAGTRPRRTFVRASAVLGPDRVAFVDQVVLVHDADRRAATARLDLAPELVGDAQWVLVDIPDGGPITDPDGLVRAGLDELLVLARLHGAVARPDLARANTTAAERLAMALGGPDAELRRESVRRAEGLLARNRHQLDFVELARLARP